ncbi:hypothetical protein ADL26_19210, partial [Thermoactinomyces vulgaris]
CGPVAGLEEQVVGAEQPRPGGLGALQRIDIGLEHPPGLAFDLHFDGVLGPAGLDLADGRVDVLGDLLVGGGSEEAEVGADGVEPVGVLARDLEAGHGLEDRRRGVGHEFE